MQFPLQRSTVVYVGLVVLLILGPIVSISYRSPLPDDVLPTQLPNLERQLIEFLLLLPVAALVCCVIRNVIGLHTFGTFAPALLGLAFREVDSIVGLFVLLIVLSFGWILRRGVSHLNLLQVPRSAVMLSLVVTLLVFLIMVSRYLGRPIASAIPFLPMIIVTGLIERFWTLEEEDGTAASMRTMGNTLLTAFLVFGVVRISLFRDSMLDYPEMLGWVISGQLLLGRYTGFRLIELRRFGDLADTFQEPKL